MQYCSSHKLWWSAFAILVPLLELLSHWIKSANMRFPLYIYKILVDFGA